MNSGTSPPARPLWQRIESIRVREGWTKVHLARVAGVDRTTLDKWAHQRRSPQPPTVKQVAERLGIDYLEALELAGITQLDESHETADQRTERLFREWKEDEERRPMLDAFLESKPGEDAG